MPNAEQQRLNEEQSRTHNWKRWGPYLSERQWGTVREDYSADGDVWNYLTHDHSRSRAYRWGEDGLLGLTDRQCRLCFGLALWNGKDPILKERLFGLTGPEGNHGEDCKELYYYLDSSPTHSYMKALYKYPQNEFPYEKLISENKKRGYQDPEYELVDTGIFDDKRYYDVFIEYAKNTPDDILIKITVANRSADEVKLHLLPTVWFRNTWIWGCEYEGCTLKPQIAQKEDLLMECTHQNLETFYFAGDLASDGELPNSLFTENETNTPKLFATESYTKYFKDAFHEYVIEKNTEAVNPARMGTKAAFHYELNLKPKEEKVIKLRLFSDKNITNQPFNQSFDETFTIRKNETDQFYSEIMPAKMTEQESLVQRQAYAGMLWSKQFYHYSVRDWLKGDREEPAPPNSRWTGRNASWQHLFNRDVISMPDKWEYPWYAAWDLAFHTIAFAKLDPQFAKDQLLLMLREWYMHPNGQIPAYEFSFDDVNPPVHAWACWRIYKMTGKRGERDIKFLEKVFHKLLMNFTWWVNRKDPEGNNIFSGGFLGLDNIGIFDRSKPLPTGGYLEQADGTAWMAFYCSTMLSIALELASFDDVYEDVASKFFEHFISIADAMNSFNGEALWDEQDGFYYDRLHTDGYRTLLRLRSAVGLIPLFAVEILRADVIDKLPGFKKRMQWFLEHRKDLAQNISYMVGNEHGSGTYLLAIPSKERLQRVVKYLMSEKEFLSDYGVRSVSKYHEANPYTFWAGEESYTTKYTPGESDSGLFGGNSNWRGPIWFPINFLLVESLEKYHHFFRDNLLIEHPRQTGKLINLKEASNEIANRLMKIFLLDENNNRPCHGKNSIYSTDEHFKDLLLFNEYFHGCNGFGLGASHQTGWTGLVAKLIEDLAKCR